MRLRLAAGVPAVIAALLLPAACGSGGTRSAARDPTSHTSTATVADSQKCLAKQAIAVYRLHDRIQRLTQVVLSQSTQTAEAEVEPLREVLHEVTARTRGSCGGDPRTLAPLVALVDDAHENAVTRSVLRRIIAEFRSWGRAVGRPRDSQILFYADPCVAVRRAVRASYLVRERPEPGGIRVWVEMTAVNDWPWLVYIEHGGTIRATGARPDGASTTYQWGGSSADTAAVKRQRTGSWAVWPSDIPNQNLHLFSYGAAAVSQVYASAYGRGFGPCGLVVRHGSRQR
jgi:hypothetical protein